MRAVASASPVHEEMKQRAREEKGEWQRAEEVCPVLGQQEERGDRGETEKSYEIAAHRVLTE